MVSGEQLEGSPVTFLTDLSFPEKVSICNWTFNDNNNVSGKKINHVFRDDGVYTVSLTVNPGKISEESVKKIVKISNILPSITSLGSDKNEVDVDGSMAFQGIFQDPGIDDEFVVSWYVNDKLLASQEESSSTILVKDHKFSDPGDYVVALVVRDDDGSEDRKETTITVNQSNWFALAIASIARTGIAGIVATNC